MMEIAEADVFEHDHLVSPIIFDCRQCIELFLYHSYVWSHRRCGAQLANVGKTEKVEVRIGYLLVAGATTSSWTC